MPIAQLERLIAAAQRKFGAAEATIEIGGLPGHDSRTLRVPVLDGARLVLRFSEPIAAPEQMDAMVRTFLTTFEHTSHEALQGLSSQFAVPGGQELAEELARTAERIQSVWLGVVDRASPIIWGCHPTHLTAKDDAGSLERYAAKPSEVEASVQDRYPDRTEEDWRRYAIVAAAVAKARVRREAESTKSWDVDTASGTGVMVRHFSRIYRLIAVVEDARSELMVDGPLSTALPRIERLVLSLPPVEPPPRGAKVVHFKPKPR